MDVSIYFFTDSVVATRSSKIIMFESPSRQGILLICIKTKFAVFQCVTPPDATMTPASKRFMVASGEGLSEGYGHGGPGVCLGDGQTEAYLKDMGMAGLESA